VLRLNNQQLNNLVLKYQNDRSDETFTQLYEMVSANWRSLETVGKSIRASKAETIAAYEDTLLNCIEKYDGRADFINMLNRSIRFKRNDIYRKKKRLSEFEVYATPVENDDGSEVAFEIKDEYNLEEYITAKKKADQLALISSLLQNADETTTAIVETFLAHPKPTATAIAKELGYHHSKVTRALTRLAAKYSTKQFGNYQDYLVAL
jgi:DNA-directed RNA polymerase specialized sigma24 family protein